MGFENNIEIEKEDSEVTSEESENETEKSIDRKRAELNKNKDKNSEMMVKKHDHKTNKKTRVFKIGDTVLLKIPRIDRTGTDLKRLPGTICKLSDDKQVFYRISTQWGILNDQYQEYNMEPYSGLVQVEL